jgi:hypothetical protein
MRIRRLTPHRAFAGVLTAALAVTLLAGCGDDGEGDDDEGNEPAASGCLTPPDDPPTAEGAAALFDVGDLADVIETGHDSGTYFIVAQTDKDMDDLVIDFQSVVEDAGFQVSGSESEEDEAEVFFQQGDQAAGQVRMRESDCPGKVDIRITVSDDPAVSPTS